MPIQPELKKLLDKTKQYEDPTLELIGSLIEYVVLLHDRISALEGGAQNRPFILPKKEPGPSIPGIL